VLLAALALAAATMAAFSNSFSGAFVFDDVQSILENPSIRDATHLESVLKPPAGGGLTVSGRPVLNLTLALNRAISGPATWSYHAVNLAIHVAAALALFGVVRRTLRSGRASGEFRAAALPVAFGAALLWAVHPLQTESVTYVVQRAESLAGLCTLVALYAFLRGVDSTRARGWFALSFSACLAGVGTKESVVVAPLLVLLYDRTFVAASWREVWRRRGGVHAMLFGTWLPLAWLVSGTAGRGGTAGFASAVSPADYALTQAGAVVHYLRLAIWPDPLVFDYGTDVVTRWTAVWPQLLAVLGFAAVVGWAVARASVWGFVGAWFFLTLAPSSSVVPVATQTMAEHRMYLPLAAAAVAVALGVQAMLRRRSMLVIAPAALALAVTTHHRNELYRSEATLATDTLAHRPDNARAHYNLANELAKAGEIETALEHYATAARLKSGVAEVHENFGNALARAGRLPEAFAQYAEALRRNPDSATTHNNLGNALDRAGRTDEALAHYARAAELRPDFGDAYYNAGVALLRARRFSDAAERFAAASHAGIDDDRLHANWATALARSGDARYALPHFARALELRPGDVGTRFNFGVALAETGQVAAAREQFAEVLRLRPDDAPAREMLARLAAEPAREGGNAK
jgi:tetratricopeptide (TPR) repeat protein